jgi:hypothetical protein
MTNIMLSATYKMVTAKAIVNITSHYFVLNL